MVLSREIGELRRIAIGIFGLTTKRFTADRHRLLFSTDVRQDMEKSKGPMTTNCREISLQAMFSFTLSRTKARKITTTQGLEPSMCARTNKGRHRPAEMEETRQRIGVTAALLFGTAKAVAAQRPRRLCTENLIRPNGRPRSAAVYQAAVDAFYPKRPAAVLICPVAQR